MVEMLCFSLFHCPEVAKKYRLKVRVFNKYVCNTLYCKLSYQNHIVNTLQQMNHIRRNNRTLCIMYHKYIDAYHWISTLELYIIHTTNYCGIIKSYPQLDFFHCNYEY